MSLVQDAYLLCKDASVGRDESHNYSHSLSVVKNALDILAREEAVYSTDDVKVVAILHDVADYKYDKTGYWKQRIMEFLGAYYGASRDDVWQAIDTISYSKEKQHGTKWYENVIGNPYWVGVRNIVSDADKLEALYSVGAIRCTQYGEKALKDKSISVTPELLLTHLNQHVIDKLGTLYTYFRTEYGISLATAGTSGLSCAVARITLNYIENKHLFAGLE